MNDFEQHNKIMREQLLHDLQHTKPIAETAFRENLEHNLMAKFDSHLANDNTKDDPMNLFNQQKQKRNQSRSRMPLTLAAAVIAIILVGGLVAIVQPMMNDDNAQPSDNVAAFATNDISQTAQGTNADQSNIANSNQQDDYARRIGLIVGNADDDSTLVCDDGLEAISITQRVVEYVALSIRRHGYIVDVFTANDPDLVDYRANFALELYTGGCGAEDEAGYFTTWYAGQSDGAGSVLFDTCLADNYEAITGIAENYPPEDALPDFNDVMNELDPSTLPYRLQIGSLAGNRDALVNNQEMIRTAIVYTLTCFMPPETTLPIYQDVVPITIATRTIELGDRITEDNVTTVLAPRDFIASLIADSGNDVVDLSTGQSTFDDELFAVVSNHDLILGQRAIALIEQFAPVPQSSLAIVDENILETTGIPMADGSVGVGIMTDDRTALLLPIGSYVDVLVAGYAQADTTGLRSLQETTTPPLAFMNAASNVRLLLREESEDGILVVVETDVETAERITYLMEAEALVTVVPHVEHSDEIYTRPTALSYPLTENGLAVINIPLSQSSSRNATNIGDVVDIGFGFYGENEPIPNNDVQAGDVIRRSTTMSDFFTVNDTTILYIGRGTEAYPNPYANDEIFISFEVIPRDTWLIEWYVANGGQFTLDHQGASTSSQITNADYMAIVPINSVDSAITHGNWVDLFVHNSDANGTNLAIENLQVVGLGTSPMSLNIPQGSVVFGDLMEEGQIFIVVLINEEQRDLLLDSVVDSTRFSIVLRNNENTRNNSMPDITISDVTLSDNADDETITLYNAGPLLDLEGWQLIDSSGYVYTFDELLLFSNAGHVLYTGNGLDSPLTSYWGLPDPIYDIGETVQLIDADGDVQAIFIIPNDE